MCFLEKLRNTVVNALRASEMRKECNQVLMFILFEILETTGIEDVDHELSLERQEYHFITPS